MKFGGRKFPRTKESRMRKENERAECLNELRHILPDIYLRL